MNSKHAEDLQFSGQEILRKFRLVRPESTRTLTPRPVISASATPAEIQPFPPAFAVSKHVEYPAQELVNQIKQQR